MTLLHALRNYNWATSKVIKEEEERKEKIL